MAKTPQQYPTLPHPRPQDYLLPTLAQPVPPYRPQQSGSFGYPEAGQFTQP